jgi:hypothetical protein
MKADAALKTVYKGTHPLSKAIIDFNFDISAYIHKTRMPDTIPSNWLDTFQKSARGKHRLNTLLRTHYGLQSEYCFDFEATDKRLLLLTADIINRLMLVAGVAYYSDTMALLIEKSKIQALKTAIGEDLYVFALKKVPILFKNRPAIELPDLFVSMDMLATIISVGKELIESIVSGKSIALIKRFELKFSHDNTWNLTRSVTPQLYTQIWNFLKKLLVCEINPALKVCFN